jgi:amidohydrolase
MDPLKERIAPFVADLVKLRRDVHAHPELGFEEVRTSELVARTLEGYGLEVHRGLGKTGVVGVLRGQGTASIAFRADIDCLPMTETGKVAHASTHVGRMHACGHDGHTAMLLGAAQVLAQKPPKGSVYFVFQPAEEGLGGGRVMVEEGLFARFPADRIFALHNWPELPAGTIAVRRGAIMAATDRFEITLRGKGGHAAIPHLTRDPVVAAAALVSALQPLVSRCTDPLDSAVLSVTSIETSNPRAFNVVPEEARLLGTFRSLRPSTRDMLRARIPEVAQGIAQAFGVSAQVALTAGYPATVNDATQADFAAMVAAKVVGAEHVRTDINPSMAAEDFSYMLEAKAGAYIWLGQGEPTHSAYLHTPGYDFNDAVLPIGTALFVALAEEALA